VGKTVLSLLLMRYFLAHGHRPFYFKPFQTGCQAPCDSDSDAKFVYDHISALKAENPAQSVLYCFKNPKAPLFAARDAQCEIKVDRVCHMLHQKSLSHAPVLLEAAGGLLVPVTENVLMIDVVKITGAKPLLAARAGLGTINHTLLAVEALRYRGLQPAGIVFIDAIDPPTPADLVRENREAVESFSGIAVAGVISKIHDFNNPDPAHRLILENLLRGAASER